ncbi:MAG TPA: alpha/beta hydrolase [Polyangiales bacterium]|nr:alpha/beta hydrolase [Polyangiales bacterium]
MYMTDLHPFGKPQQFIDLGHSRVPHYRVGRGPDLLFVHGWPLHSATFRAIVPRLADRFTCHLIDLPGTGASEWGPDSKISVLDHAQTLRSVVDRLELSDYAVIAHDSGAVFARLMAAGDARLRALVLGNTEIPGHHPPLLQMLMTLERVPFGPQLLGLGLQLRPIRWSTLAYGACFHDPAFTDGEFGRLFIAPMRDPRVFEGQRRLLRKFDWSVVDSLRDVHARLHMPVKLIWGAQDPYFPLAKLKPTLSQYAGGASVHVIDPGKLFAHEEFAEEFARETRGFLERCWRDEAHPSLRT